MVTPEFLKHYELSVKDEGLSKSTINGIFRNLRRIINYFIHEEKVIPKSYDYPFGRSGYSVRSFFGRKLVMTNDEIQKVIDLRDFDNKDQEYARDIWMFLYRANGINFADLLRMRWSHIQGGYLIFYRKKTETTRKNNVKPITVPLKLKTARDCYATTLRRTDVSKDNIGEMLGHANSVVTEHYLASLDIEKTHEISQYIL